MSYFFPGCKTLQEQQEEEEEEGYGVVESSDSDSDLDEALLSSRLVRIVLLPTCLRATNLSL